MEFKNYEKISDNIYHRGHRRKMFERRKNEERAAVDQDFFSKSR